MRLLTVGETYKYLILKLGRYKDVEITSISQEHLSPQFKITYRYKMKVFGCIPFWRTDWDYSHTFVQNAKTALVMPISSLNVSGCVHMPQAVNATLLSSSIA